MSTDDRPLAFVGLPGSERELGGDRFFPRRLRPFILACALSLSGGILPAAELAPGLIYLRPGVELTPQTGSAVLDLRASLDEAALVPLLAAIAPGSNNPQRLLLILVSPDTPEGVRRHIALLPRCITVGRSEPGLKTDITVTTTAEADRRAIQALAAGTAPEKLLVENADKRRYDESSLVREHTGLAEPSQEKPAPPSSVNTGPASEPGDSNSPDSPPPAVATPVDAVLQRALHLYRGLVVLKKA